MAQQTKDDPALWDADRRDGYLADRAQKQAVREACSRPEPSMDALVAKYSLLAEVRTVNTDAADRLMTEYETRAKLEPALADGFEWMRLLAGALRKVVA